MAGYVTAFGVGALAGIANELLQNHNHWCLTSPNLAKVLATCTIGNIYGWAAMISVGLFGVASRRNIPWWVQVLTATVAIAGVEGAAGVISRKFHDGEQKWKYPACWYPIFGDSVSLVSTVYFGLGVLAFYWLAYKPLLSKI